MDYQAKRLNGETFEAYQERRRAEHRVLKDRLRGNFLAETGRPTSRKRMYYKLKKRRAEGRCSIEEFNEGIKLLGYDNEVVPTTEKKEVVDETTDVRE